MLLTDSHSQYNWFKPPVHIGKWRCITIKTINSFANNNIPPSLATHLKQIVQKSTRKDILNLDLAWEGTEVVNGRGKGSGEFF